MLDLTMMKKKSEIDNAIYNAVNDVIRSYCAENDLEFREMGKKTEIKIGKTLDKDKEEVDIWCKIEPLVHKYFVTTSTKTGKVLPAFDIDKTYDEWKMKREEIDQRAEEKRLAKEKKLAKKSEEETEVEE